MKIQIRSLSPGDIVETAGMSAIFLTSVRHPLWKNLRLVIWWIITEHRWSFDALSPDQMVHVPRQLLPEEKDKNLQRILLGND